MVWLVFARSFWVQLTYKQQAEVPMKKALLRQRLKKLLAVYATCHNK